MEKVTWLTWDIPRWLLMWAIACTMFAVFKALTLAWVKAADSSVERKTAYLFLWPGMDACAFLTGRAETSPSLWEWFAALLKTLIGLAFLWLSRHAEHPLVAGWTAMIGIALFLHFGVFHLLSCFWRARGVHAPPLMNRPLRATSVSAFWGKHWNVAFRDLTHRLVFRPLRRKTGAEKAMLGGFVFSGLLHELAITVPAGGGYGGPTLFFTLQGLALLFERSRPGRRLGLGSGPRGWTFTQGLLLLTVPLLFPPPFVLRVINPFLDFLHGLLL